MTNKLAQYKVNQININNYIPWKKVINGHPDVYYGIFGEEDFLVNLTLQSFLKSPAFITNSNLNIEYFLAEQTPPNRILETAHTLPLLGNKRLIFVKNCDQYKTNQLNEFVPYFKNPVPSTCIVFAGTKLDQRSQFSKFLKKTGNLQIFKRLYPNQVAFWLIKRSKFYNKKLLPEAATHLSKLAILGLGFLDSELEKLSFFIGERKQISLSDVTVVTNQERLYSIFDLTNALIQGSLKQALIAYNQLHSLGESPVKILAMITHLYRQVIKTYKITKKCRRKLSTNIQKELRIPLNTAHSLLEYTKNQKEQNIITILKKILLTDIKLKSFSSANRANIENLIINICIKHKNNYANS